MAALPQQPCARCGSPIIWAITTADKRIPLDVDPNPRGNVVLEPTLLGLRAVVVKATAQNDDERFMPHFATCGASARRWPALKVLGPS
ncbi:MAG TPA: hypothetical protein VNL71_23320 [Chloroflexota bacterium]|nr:hypothetical protein [Chloroflexota bacterium]